jgi:hypothetical protein
MGAGALNFNTIGHENTAYGVQALSNNNNSGNTAVGFQALFNNAGDANTACGQFSLMSNDVGIFNSAFGQGSLASNTTGGDNTASGAGALFSNTSGDENTAIGFQALDGNSTGSANTAVGIRALVLNTGSDNIGIGNRAGQNLTTGVSNVDIANDGVAGEERTTRIGQTGVQTRTFIAAIRGVITGNNNAIPVLVDSAGQLGTTSSSRRYKKEIKPMDKGSEAILSLKPVTFHYKSDRTNRPEFGLIAEEVAEVNPDLVVRDQSGEIYTVRYDAVNAMLLNEFLKEHKRVEALKSKAAEQDATVAELKSTLAKQEATITQQQQDFQCKLAEQEKQIEALTSGLQKVRAQVETNRPEPRVASNGE